jgi:hypothetical protein
MHSSIGYSFRLGRVFASLNASRQPARRAEKKRDGRPERLVSEPASRSSFTECGLAFRRLEEALWENVKQGVGLVENKADFDSLHRYR